MIRVFLADDQALVRGALTALLSLEPDIEVVGEASDGREALEAIVRLQPDVALVDIEMPHMDGLSLTSEVTACSSVATRILIVTTFGRAGYLRRALDNGAYGFLVKDAPPAELAEAIRSIHSGMRVVDPQLAQDSVLMGSNPLTDREREALLLVGEGVAVADIARRLHISYGTARNYVSSAMTKVQATNRVEAARRARDNGWL